MKKKKRVKRINFLAVFVLILVCYLFFSFLYYIFSLPIKNIIISGNNYVSDAEIIELADIKNYPSLSKVSRSKIEKRLLKNKLIDKVEISKKLNGTVTISVVESNPIFINRATGKVVLLNGSEIENKNILDLPQLVNNVPQDLYKKLITAFSKVNYNLIYQISEIEYSPDIINEKVIDAERFYLRMKDGNSVYINPVNISRLNNYYSVYEKIPEGVKGTLYFDSNSDNNMFKIYGEKKAEVVEDEL